MLAKYVWLSGATQANMLADLCALISGSPISGLSSSCDKVNSSIIADALPNNWTVFDSAASASAKVLRSGNSDGTYKYAHLSYSANTLSLASHESWNASTHVGTNPAFRITGTGLTVPVSTAFATTGGTLYIYATSDMLLFCLKNVTSISSIPCVVEFVRMSPFIDGTYPCHSLSGALCRFKYANAIGDCTLNSTPSVSLTGGTQFLTDLYLRSVSGQGKYCAEKLYQTCALAPPSVTTIGELKSLLLLRSHPTANFLDEIDVDGVRHVLITTSTATTSTMSFIVPKG